jgi:hypothetical protein
MGVVNLAYAGAFSSQTTETFMPIPTEKTEK